MCFVRPPLQKSGSKLFLVPKKQKFLKILSHLTLHAL